MPGLSFPVAVNPATTDRPAWFARQEYAPPDVRRLIGEAFAELAAEEQAREDAARKAFAELAAYRQDFEGSLVAILAGNEWLAAYRVPDAEWDRCNRFSLDRKEWWAFFDLTPIGCHPISVALLKYQCDPGWFAVPYAWGVELPTGRRACPNLAQTIRLAGTIPPDEIPF